MKARLLDIQELAPLVRHLEFEAVDADRFEFTPGQFVSLKQKFEGKEIIRPYSIASAQQANRFALCLNLVEDGMFSPYLFKLRQGDEVEISPPLGYFTLRNRDRELLLIATGTGVAPFRSMLHSHLAELELPVTLLFGTRHEQTLLYRNEFEDFEKRHSHFRFWPTLTRPGPEWKGRSGRVQSHLDQALKGKSAVDVYLCGLKEMVDDVRASLKQRGFDRKQIIFEKYD